jgi:aerobic carbon-monoxide dehydrogenase large subunit
VASNTIGPPVVTPLSRYVGSSIRRVEDVPLLLGRTSFVADIHREDELHMRVVRSNSAHARITALHADVARGWPGVVAVFTAEDIPAVRIPIRLPFAATPEAQAVLQPALATDRVRYVGEPLAVVVATNRSTAEDAAREVWAEFDELAPLVNTRDAASPGAFAIHSGLGSNVVNRIPLKYGEDVDQVFKSADLVVSAKLRMQRHTAVPLETRGLIAEYDSENERLTVWGAAKVKHFNRAVLSQMIGIPTDRIRLIEGHVGGGFGVRGEFYPEDFLVPWIAWKLRRPVKWIEDRHEHFVAANHSREHEHEIEMAATSDGQLLAFRDVVLYDMGAWIRTHGILVPLLLAGHLAGPYRWRGFEAAVSAVLTNKTPAGTYRAPGVTEATFARERMIDMVAAKLGLDAADIRRRNLIPSSTMPFTFDLGPNAMPLTYESGDYPAFLETLLSKMDYEGLRVEQRERRMRGEAIGIGLSAFVEAVGVGPFEQAVIEPQMDGSFSVQVGVASVGQGLETVLAQIAADEMGVPLDKVKIAHHDTDVLPEGFGTFASRSTMFAGNAIVAAVGDLKANAVAEASRRFNIPADDLVAAAGTVTRRTGASPAVPIADLGVRGEGSFEKDDLTYSFGANLSMVSLDPETGTVTPLKHAVAYDVGRAINPVLLQGQLVGAAAQGIGGALFEELAFDDQGQPQSTSFVDYLIPTVGELPPIEAIVLEHPTRSNPLGIKGGGEAGMTGAPAAVANAVADAIGAHASHLITELPLAPLRVWRLLEGQREE